MPFYLSPNTKGTVKFKNEETTKTVISFSDFGIKIPCGLAGVSQSFEGTPASIARVEVRQVGKLIV
jgi:hypothetical protein